MLLPNPLRSGIALLTLAGSCMAVEAGDLAGSNIADPLASKSRFFEEITHSSGGYWIWSGLARLTRLSFRNGHDYLPALDELSLDNFDFQSLLDINYFLPFIVFLGSILVTLLITFCSGCFICTCCRSRLRRRQKDPFTKRQRVMSIILVTFVFFCWLAAAAAGLRASVSLNRTVDMMGQSAEQAFKDIADMRTNITALVDEIFTTVVSGIDEVTDNAIDYEALGPVQDHINAMKVHLEALNNKVDAVFDLMEPDAGLEKTMNDIVSVSNDLTASINVANGMIAELTNSDPHSCEDGYYYWNGADPDLEVPVSDLADVNDAMVSSSNALGASNAAGTPRHSISAIPLMAPILDALNIDIAELVHSLADPNVATIKAQADDAIEEQRPVIDDAFSQIDDVQKYKIDKDRYEADIDKYAKIVMYVCLAVFALPIVILLVMAGGMAGKRPGLVRGCLFASVPYTLLALLFCFILVLVCVVLGEVCTVAFTVNPETSKPFLATLLPSVEDTITKGFAARESCLNDVDVLDVVEAFGVAIPDVHATVMQQVNGITFGSIADELDLESLLEANNPSDDVSSHMQDARTKVGTLNDQVTDDITTSENALGALRTSLGAAITALGGPAFDASHLEYITGANVAGPLPPVCEADFVQRKTAAATALQAVDAGVGDMLVQLGILSNDMETLVDSIDGAIADLGSASTEYVSTETSIGTWIQALIDFLSDTGPNGLKDQISTLVEDVVFLLEEPDIYCTSIATTITDVEVAMCDGALGSLDGYWFSFYILGAVGALSLPVFIQASNVLADVEAKKQKGSGGPKSKKDKDKNNKKKGAGKKDTDVETGQIKWTSPKPEIKDPSQVHPTIRKTSALNVEEQSSLDALDHNTADSNVVRYPSLGRPQEGYKHDSIAVTSPLAHMDMGRPPSFAPVGPPSHAGYASSYQESGIPEVRPPWLNPDSASGGMSPHAHHPHIPMSSSFNQAPQYSDYYDSNFPQQERRYSHAQHQPVYDGVIDQLHKRLSNVQPETKRE
ncbi:hypothetical protein BC832DRAFT_556779 [Gaertneriomyces semiglobifer]|nr:hypothetical protein BC832DRAFT_556779 [Gaertneriomyces semiglobifer]